MPLPFIQGADRDYYNQTGGILLHTKAVGVTFEGRQDVISNMPRSAQVKLEWDRDNQYDDTAIGVYYDGKSIGFINKDLAVVLFPYVKKYTQDVTAEITGGNDGKSYGVNLTIRFLSDSSTQISRTSYTSKNKSPRKTSWIFIIIGIQFSASMIRYGIGGKSLSDFIGDSIVYIVWFLCAILVQKPIQKKMNTFWSTLISLILGYLITLIAGVLIGGLLGALSSSSQSKLRINSENIPYVSNISLPTHLKSKNIDTTFTPVPQEGEKVSNFYFKSKDLLDFIESTIAYNGESVSPVCKPDRDNEGDYFTNCSYGNGNYLYLSLNDDLLVESITFTGYPAENKTGSNRQMRYIMSALFFAVFPDITNKEILDIYYSYLNEKKIFTKRADMIIALYERTNKSNGLPYLGLEIFPQYQP